MTATERQNLLLEEYSLIDDPRERFQLIVETAASSDPFPEEQRRDENLVRGCVSKTWLSVKRQEDGTFKVAIESESPALDAIAGLFCRVYSGSSAPEILTTEPDFVARLGIDRHLTPTRLRGLQRLREMLVERTAALADSGER